MDGRLTQAQNKYFSNVPPQTRDSGIIIKSHSLQRPLSSRGYFDSVLSNSGPDIKKRKLSNTQLVLISLAIACLTLGGYFTYSGMNALRVSNLQAATLTKLANKSTGSASGNKTINSVSSAPISASTLANYTVAANMPRYLMIPKLNVKARVLPVGVNSIGEVGTPDDIYDTSWYTGSAQPGQPGAMLIDGHVSSWTANGVFYGLKTLAPGDTIQVQRGDGTIFSYKVINSQVYPASAVNMKAALSPIVPGHPGLNLITCSGDVLPGTSEFSERIVVYTEQI